MDETVADYFYKTNLSLNIIYLLFLYQENAVNYWMDQYGWKATDGSFVTVSNQEEIIKTRNITEKIDVESVASIMASCY